MTVKPELKGVISPGSPKVGEEITVTLYENVPGSTIKLEYKATANLGATLAKQRQDADGAVFTGKATQAGDLVVKCDLTRTYDGAKAPTLTLTATVTAPPPPTPTGTTRMGVSMSDEKHPDKDSGPNGALDGAGVDWQSAHCYNQGDVQDAVPFRPKNVDLSDSAVWNANGPASLTAVRGSIRSALATMDRWDTAAKMNYSWGNEVNRHVSAYAQFGSNVASLGAMVDAEFSDRVRFGVSFTGEAFRSSKLDPFKDTIRRELTKPNRFIAVNPYPPGRQKSPPVATDFADYIDPILDGIVALGVKVLSFWEVGIPTFTNSNGFANRAAYAKALAAYAAKECADRGITLLSFDWWDQDIGIDNRLYHDWANTAQAWAPA